MKLTKTHIRYFVLLSTVLACVLFIVFGKNNTHDLPRNLQSGKLIVEIDSGFMAYAELGDSTFGLQYEILKVFADSLELELIVLQENNLKNSIKDLLNDECDLVASLVPATNQWGKKVAFTTPLLITRLVLVQRMDTAIKIFTQQYELANDTVYIAKNSPQRLRIENLSDEIADSIQIVEVAGMSQEQMVAAVAKGELKNTVCDARLARMMKKRYPNLNIVLPLGFEQSYCWTVRAESPILLEKLNEFLQNFIDSPAYWEIYRKYADRFSPVKTLKIKHLCQNEARQISTNH